MNNKEEIKEEIRKKAKDLLGEIIMYHEDADASFLVEQRIKHLHFLCETQDDRIPTFEDLIMEIDCYNDQIYYEASILLFPLDYDCSEYESIIIADDLTIQIVGDRQDWDDDVDEALRENAYEIQNSFEYSFNFSMESYILSVCDKFNMSIRVNDVDLTTCYNEVIVGDAQNVLLPELLANGITGSGLHTILHYGYQRGVVCV